MTNGQMHCSGSNAYRSSEERSFPAVSVREGCSDFSNEGKEERGYVEGPKLGNY